MKRTTIVQSSRHHRLSPTPNRSAERTALHASIAIQRRGIHGLPILLAAALLVATSGCGVSIDQLVVQSGAALGRSYLDLLLTDLGNALAERAEQDQDLNGDDDADDTDGDGGGDGDGDGGGDGDADGGGGSLDDLTGDPAAGEPLFASCGGCHCADASGGCLPGAPALVGVSAETLNEHLRGDAAHPAKVNLTDQELVDLQAYLASLGG